MLFYTLNVIHFFLGEVARMTDEKASIEEDLFAKSLCMMFSVAWLRETAKRTNFIKREREIQPEVFFGVISLGYGVSLVHAQ
jgi:hypothetical protein